MADIVRRAGGKALLVGGCVRDRLLGLEPKDFDLECFGIGADALVRALSERYELDLVGASFGVIKLKHLPIDVSLPRRETKLGLGHRAFSTQCVENLSLAEAAARRDFTVNAVYEDVLGGGILDPWGGVEDLGRRVLRHVSGHFREDPLRVLRAMQFIARFALKPDPSTVSICSEMESEGLPRERLLEEWMKLIVKGVRISEGLEFLRVTRWLRYYPELGRLVGCRQEPLWHPEGDVWEHTKLCLDHFASRRTGDAREDAVVGFAVLCHDFGKPDTTFSDPAAKRIRSPGHDEAGVAPAESFMRALTNEERFVKEVSVLVRLHMRPFSLWQGNAGDGAVRRLAAESGRIDRLVRVCASDVAGQSECDARPLEWLLERAEALRIKDSAPKPVVQGRDLIAAGMKPSAEFGRILAAAYEAQLDGVFSDLAGGVDFVKGVVGGKKAPPEN